LGPEHDYPQARQILENAHGEDVKLWAAQIRVAMADCGEMKLLKLPLEDMGLRCGGGLGVLWRARVSMLCCGLRSGLIEGQRFIKILHKEIEMS
jgi:hypothetical protein